MRLLLVALFCSILVASADLRNCSRVETPDEIEYHCTPLTGNVIIRIGDDYANIQCDDVRGGHFRCEELPLVPELHGVNLKVLGLTYCRLPSSPLACVLRALNVSTLRHLVLRDTPEGAAAALRPDTFEGLELSALTLIEVPSARPVQLPLPALATLPALHVLNVRGAPLLLAPGAFSSTPALNKLELISCNISSLPPNVFRGLPTLRRLFLRSNIISKLAPSSFDGLNVLEDLDLSSNQLRIIPKGAFLGTPRLRTLMFGMNPLELLEAGAMRGLTSLERIDIFDGREALRLGAAALGALPNVTWMRVSQCALKELSSDVFTGSSSLLDLNLAANRLRQLPDDLLRDQRELRNLDLSDNEIVSISPQLFAALSQLEILNLSKNLIEVLPERVFSQLKNLWRMSISDNHLVHIAPNAFRGASALRTLSLSHNSLSLRNPRAGSDKGADAGAGGPDDLGLYGEEQSPLVSLLALKYLDLSYNYIDTIFFDWRYNIEKLTKLNLTYNNITVLTESDINFIQQNITVDLRYNNITTIILLSTVMRDPRDTDDQAKILFDSKAFDCDCRLVGLLARFNVSQPAVSEPRLEPGDSACAAPPELHAFPLRKLPARKLVCDLPHCPLHCAACHLRPFERVIELNCDEPPQHPTLETFYKVNNLENFTVALKLGRSISSLTRLSPQIRMLSLAGLNLKSAPRGPVPPSLEELDLSNNKLSSIPVKLLGAVHLHLAQNPFVCDCDHADEVVALQRHNKSVEDLREIRCEGGAWAWRIEPETICGARRAAGTAAAIVALIALLIGVAALLVYRLRERLRAFLLAHSWCLSWLGDGEEPYDAFVAFALEDRRLVMDKIVAQLEQEGYRLCVQYRDWGAGGWVPMEITRSVREARRTVLALSPRLQADPYSEQLLRAAGETTARGGKRARVVVMVLEGSTKVAEWRGRLEGAVWLCWGEGRFWQRLRCALGRRAPRPIASPSSLDSWSPEPSALDVWVTQDGKLLPLAKTKC